MTMKGKHRNTLRTTRPGAVSHKDSPGTEAEPPWHRLSRLRQIYIRL
jgi:hypothetical protein